MYVKGVEKSFGDRDPYFLRRSVSSLLMRVPHLITFFWFYLGRLCSETGEDSDRRGGLRRETA